MQIKRIVSSIVGITGLLFLMLALLAGLVSISALVERIRYGPGLMFATVEFFGLVALVCGGVGLLLIALAKKLGKL